MGLIGYGSKSFSCNLKMGLICESYVPKKSCHIARKKETKNYTNKSKHLMEVSS